MKILYNAWIIVTGIVWSSCATSGRAQGIPEQALSSSVETATQNVFLSTKRAWCWANRYFTSCAERETCVDANVILILPTSNFEPYDDSSYPSRPFFVNSFWLLACQIRCIDSGRIRGLHDVLVEIAWLTAIWV